MYTTRGVGAFKKHAAQIHQITFEGIHLFFAWRKSILVQLTRDAVDAMPQGDSLAEAGTDGGETDGATVAA